MQAYYIDAFFGPPSAGPLLQVLKAKLRECGLRVLAARRILAPAFPRLCFSGLYVRSLGHNLLENFYSPGNFAILSVGLHTP